MSRFYKSLVGLCVAVITLCIQSSFQVEASALGAADWKWPVPVSNSLSSCYIDGREHYAIDISAPRGSEIYASREGEVIYTYASCRHNYGKYDGCGCNHNLGNSVSIRHTYNGVSYVSRYGHLTSVNVSVGDKVTIETVIGTVGSTGYSQNHHLDFRIYEGTTEEQDSAENCIDPLGQVFLDIPDGLNANRASTGCCYSYVRRIMPPYNEIKAARVAEQARLAEKARLAKEQKAFEEARDEAARQWIENEICSGYLEKSMCDLRFGLENFLRNYK